MFLDITSYFKHNENTHVTNRCHVWEIFSASNNS